jgi:hypothetical protein
MFRLDRDSHSGASEWRFECRCGCTRCERIEVARAGRSAYITEFVRCVICRAVFHWGSHDLPSSVTNASFPANYGALAAEDVLSDIARRERLCHSTTPRGRGSCPR